jgi:hypothetical protein
MLLKTREGSAPARWSRETAQYRLAAILLATACGGDARPEAFDVHTVPVLTVTLDQTVVALEADPIAIVGGANDAGPGISLHLVRDALLMADGGFVLANEGSQSLLYFDSIGRFVREVGGAGDGPGEFRLLRSLGLHGADTVVAWDLGPRRLTVFDTSGSATTTIALAGAEGIDSRSARTRILHTMGRERYAAISSNLGRQPHERHVGFARDSHSVAFLDRSGRVVDTVGVIPGNEWFRGAETLPAPFSYRLVTGATEASLYLGYGRGPELFEYSPDGRLNRLIRLPIKRGVISRADRDAIRERYLLRFRPAERQTVGITMDQAFVVDSFPAFTNLKTVAGSYSVWVELYRPPESPRRWLIIDPEAGIARHLDLPIGATLLAADTNRVVILGTDQLERQEIRVYRIVGLVYPSDQAMFPR